MCIMRLRQKNRFSQVTWVTPCWYNSSPPSVVNLVLSPHSFRCTQSVCHNKKQRGASSWTDVKGLFHTHLSC